MNTFTTSQGEAGKNPALPTSSLKRDCQPQEYRPQHRLYVLGGIEALV